MDYSQSLTQKYQVHNNIIHFSPKENKQEGVDNKTNSISIKRFGKTEEAKENKPTVWDPRYVAVRVNINDSGETKQIWVKVSKTSLIKMFGEVCIKIGTLHMNELLDIQQKETIESGCKKYVESKNTSNIDGANETIDIIFDSLFELCQTTEGNVVISVGSAGKNSGEQRCPNFCESDDIVVNIDPEFSSDYVPSKSEGNTVYHLPLGIPSRLDSSKFNQLSNKHTQEKLIDLLGKCLQENKNVVLMYHVEPGTVFNFQEFIEDHKDSIGDNLCIIGSYQRGPVYMLTKNSVIPEDPDKAKTELYDFFDNQGGYRGWEHDAKSTLRRAGLNEAKPFRNLGEVKRTDLTSGSKKTD